jgi:hypothetical protein
VIYVRDSRNKNWTGFDEKKLLKYTTDRFAEIIETRRQQSKEEEIDIHSILVSEIQKEGDEVVNTGSGLSTFSSSENPSTGVSTLSSINDATFKTPVMRTAYIVLDSKFRSATSDGITSFNWAFAVNNPNNLPGSVSVIGEVRDIMSVRISPFRLPNIESVFSNPLGRTTMAVREWRTQSTIAQEKWYYHFMFAPFSAIGMIDLVPLPDPNSSIYGFRLPVQLNEGITIQFGNPFIPITFLPDRYIATATSIISSPAPSGVYMTTFFTLNDNTLEVGDLISQFGSFPMVVTNPNNVPEYLAAMNGTTGVIVAALTATTFSVVVNLQNATLPLMPDPISFSFYIENRRILVPLELNYVASALST